MDLLCERPPIQQYLGKVLIDVLSQVIDIRKGLLQRRICEVIRSPVHKVHSRRQVQKCTQSCSLAFFMFKEPPTDSIREKKNISVMDVIFLTVESQILWTPYSFPGIDIIDADLYI